MRKSIVPFCFLLCCFHVYGQPLMQGTIKPGSTPGTIDIYLKPSASFSQKDEAMTFALAVPATAMPAPAMGSSGVTANDTGAVSGITGLQPRFLTDSLGSLLREVVVSTEAIRDTEYYIYTFLFTGTALAVHDWQANTEQRMFSIAFNGCTAGCNPGAVLLVNLPGGGEGNISYWYFQPNTLGDITNYPAPFYGNPQSGPPLNGGSTDGSVLSTIGLVASAVNQPPVANAGGDQTYPVVPVPNIALDGSASFDPDGTITAYHWTMVTPLAGTITSPDSAKTTVTGLVQGTYIFVLTVTDNAGASTSDSVTIKNAVNLPPIARAGPDQTITLPADSVLLNGTASTDPDGRVVGYHWTKLTSLAGTINMPFNAVTPVTGLVQGTHVFVLTVIDNLNGTGSDTVIVTVKAASACMPNITIVAPSCSSKVAITWTEPHDTFPDTITVKSGISLTAARLNFKGAFNGHGYYASNDQYSWTNARDAAADVGGHLVTITTPDENNFIFTHLNQRNNYAWIGLYNPGKVDSFVWVTGEPLGFTNWIPGQPDNLWHDPSFVHESYVHINGWADPDLCRWNDNSTNITAIFLAEFDKAMFTYRQISGPVNGSAQLPGVYAVCYERTNTATAKKDTCCFSVTISCNGALATSLNSSAVTEPSAHDISRGLRMLIAPNPSSNYFSLRVTGSSTERISVQLSDVSGRIVEKRNIITPGQTMQTGSDLRPGIYFIQITQGNEKLIRKIIKLSE